MIAVFLYAGLQSPRFCEKVEMYLQQYAVDWHLIVLEGHTRLTAYLSRLNVFRPS